MKSIEILGIISSVVLLVGYIFIIKKIRVGFLIWLVSNIMFIIYNVVIQSWSQFFVNIVFLCVNTIGFINWKTEPKLIKTCQNCRFNTDPDSFTGVNCGHPHLLSPTDQRSCFNDHHLWEKEV